MRQVFPYYGSKRRFSKRIRPRIGLPVVEPFGGSAAFSLRWESPNATILDTSDDIVAAWAWIQKASEDDVLALPDSLEKGSRIEHPYLKFWCSPGSGPGRTMVTQRGASGQSRWMRRKKQWLIDALAVVKTWTILHANYRDAPNIEATWFIDPPYVGQESQYKCPAVNRGEMWEWIGKLKGLIIVTDSVPAPDGRSVAMEYTATVKANSKTGTRRSVEYVWTRYQ